MAVQSLRGRLVAVKSTGEDGSNFPVHGDACYIGRALGCNIRIGNDELRDRHCVIKVSDLGKITIHNLDFEKPVLLNDKEVSCDGCTVEVGDLIRILNYTFRWEKAEAQDDLIKFRSSLVAEKTVPAADVLSERYSAPPCLLGDESKENREKVNEKSDDYDEINFENGVEEEKFEDCFEEMPDMESRNDMLHPNPVDPSMDTTSLDDAQDAQSLLQSPRCFDNAYHSTPKCTPAKSIPKDCLNSSAVSCDLAEQLTDVTQSPSKLRGRRSTGIVPCVGTPSDVYRTTRGILTPANKTRFDRMSTEVEISLGPRDSLDTIMKSAKRFRQRSSERKSTPLKPRVSDKSMARDSIIHSPIIEDYSREKCEESQNESGGTGDSKYRFVASRRRRPFRGSSFAVENRIAEESETGQSDLTSDECTIDEENSLIASSYCDKFIENSFEKSGELAMSARIIVNGDTRASDDELNSTFTIDVHDDEKEESPMKSSVAPPKSILTPLPDALAVREKSAKKVTFAHNVIDKFGESSPEATTLTDSDQTSAPASLASIDVSDVDLTNKARNSEESFCRNEALYMADETPSEEAVSPVVVKVCSTPVGYVHVEGVKRIFKTPCGAHATYDNVEGVRRLLRTPGSPACSYENVDGVADLLKTPKAAVIAEAVERVVTDATLIESPKTVVESEPVEEALMDVVASDDTEVRSQVEETTEEAANSPAKIHTEISCIEVESETPTASEVALSSPAKSDAEMSSTEVESESPEKVEVALSTEIENETQEEVEMASSVSARSETLEEMSVDVASAVDEVDSETEEVAQETAGTDTENVLVEASTAANETPVVEVTNVDLESETTEAVTDGKCSEESARVGIDSEPVEVSSVANEMFAEKAARIYIESEPVEASAAADETSAEEAARIDTESEPVKASATENETSADEVVSIDSENEPVKASTADDETPVVEPANVDPKSETGEAAANEKSRKESVRVDPDSKPVEASAVMDETSAEEAARINIESEPVEMSAAADETFAEEAAHTNSENEPEEASTSANDIPVVEAASVDPESETMKASAGADETSAEEAAKIDTASRPAEASAALDETSAEKPARIDAESEPVEMSTEVKETSIEALANALPEPVSETSFAMTNVTVGHVEIDPAEPPAMLEVVCTEIAPSGLSDTAGEVVEEKSMDAAPSIEAVEERSAEIASTTLLPTCVEQLVSQTSDEPTESEAETEPMESLELPDSAVSESASTIIESGRIEEASVVSQTSVEAEQLEAETELTKLPAGLTNVVAEASIQPPDMVAMEASAPSDDVSREITFPCNVATPLPNYKDVDGMKRLFKTPCNNQADYSDVEGVEQLMKTPVDPCRSSNSAVNPVIQILKINSPDSIEKPASIVSKPVQRNEQKAKSVQNEEHERSQKSIEKIFRNPILQITKVDVPEHMGAKATQSTTGKQKDEEPPKATRVSSRLKNIENVYPGRGLPRSKRVSGKLTKTLSPSPVKSIRTSIEDLTSPFSIVISALDTRFVDGIGDDTEVSKGVHGDRELTAKRKRASKKSATKCVTFSAKNSRQTTGDQETIPVVKAKRSTRAKEPIAGKEVAVPKKSYSKRVTFAKRSSPESRDENTTPDKVESRIQVVKPVAEKEMAAPMPRSTRGRRATPLENDSISRQPVARATRRAREAPSSDEVQPPEETKKRAVRAGLADKSAEPTAASLESPAKGKRATRSGRERTCETADPKVASSESKRKRTTRGSRMTPDEDGDAVMTNKRMAVTDDDAKEPQKPAKPTKKDKVKASSTAGVENEAPRATRAKRAKTDKPPADETKTVGARPTRNRKEVTVLKKTLVTVTKKKTVVKRRLSIIDELREDEPVKKKAKPVSVKSSQVKDGGKKTAEKTLGNIKGTAGETVATNSRRPTRTAAKKSEKKVTSPNKQMVGARAAKKSTAAETKGATRLEIGSGGRVTRNRMKATASTTRSGTRRE